MMPGWLVRCIPYAIVLAIVGLTHWWAYNRGEAHTRTAYELKMQELRTAAVKALADAERAAREKEADSNAALAAESRKHLEEARHAQMEIDSLRADLRASRIRLSVPVARCSAGSSSGADSAAASGSGAEAQAELMPATAEALVGIAAEGDAAVRQLNRCIDAYDAVRARYNEVR